MARRKTKDFGQNVHRNYLNLIISYFLHASNFDLFDSQINDDDE
jgi:hypothetical protein